ncbi:MAG: TlpA family protein disulfide reductase [Caldisericum exile]|uniref:TlpA family protein disulfide reductase n=1 Tax=Caldisericum exile TaxID=693075 RepID=UPI003C735CA5
MKFQKVNLFCLLILFSLETALSETIDLNVFDFENKPLKYSHLVILNIHNDSVIEKYEINKNGMIKVNFSKVGFYRLRITGINHKATTFPIYFKGENKIIKLEIKLEPIYFKSIPQKIPVIGNFNHWNFDKPLFFEKKSDKLFILKFENKNQLDKLQYQIVIDDTIKGEFSQRSVNGLVADQFYLDAGNEDYVSEIKVRNKDIIEIELDISKYPKIKIPPQVVFKDPEYQEFYRTFESIKVLRKEIEVEKVKLEKEHNTITSLFDKLTLKKVKGIYSNHLKKLEDLFNKSNNIMSKKLIAIEYIFYSSHLIALKMQPFVKILSNIELNQKFIKKLLNTIEPNSPLWGYYEFYNQPVKGITSILLYINDNIFHKYLNDLVLTNPIKEVQIDALETAIEICFDIKKDKQNGNYFLQILSSNFPNSEAAKIAEDKYGNKGKVRVGSKLTDFEFSLISPQNDIKKTTLVQFQNKKYLLLDFWATWCKPCIAEFPYLKEAYNNFKNKNFEILSISFDEDPHKVINFISKKNFPWHFAIETNGFNSKIAKNLEIFAIPFTVLLSPDGTVVAKGGELRGNRLIETLKKHLK